MGVSFLKERYSLGKSITLSDTLEQKVKRQSNSLNDIICKVKGTACFSETSSWASYDGKQTNIPNQVVVCACYLTFQCNRHLHN